MNTEIYPESMSALEVFEPAPDVVYSIEQTARLAHIPRRLIAVYFRYGLVSPIVDPEIGGWYFNDEAIRTLRQVEYLRSAAGMTPTGIKLVLDLMHELERLREEVRFLREL